MVNTGFFFAWRGVLSLGGMYWKIRSRSLIRYKKCNDQCTILHVPNQSDSNHLLCDSGTTRFLLVLSFVSRRRMRTHLSSWPVGTAYPGTPLTNSHPILDTNSSALTVPSNRTQLTPGKSTFKENKKSYKTAKRQSSLNPQLQESKF